MKNIMIAAKIKKLREDNYLRVGEMARRLKLSHTAIGKLERGEILPSIETLYNLWIELGYDPKDIVELMGKITESKEEKNDQYQ